MVMKFRGPIVTNQWGGSFFSIPRKYSQECPSPLLSKGRVLALAFAIFDGPPIPLELLLGVFDLGVQLYD